MRFFCKFLLLAFLIPITAFSEELSDRTLYQEIFKLHENNEYKKAESLISKLQNPLLMGYVLYQQYFSPHYKTKKKEIVSWLENYSDYPIAGEIYALGKQKKISSLPRPKGIFGGNTHACEHVSRFEATDLIKYVSFSNIRNKEKRKKAQKQMRQFGKYLSRGSTLNAKNLVNMKENQKLWGEKMTDNARIALAFSYFLDNRDDLAQKELNQTLSHKPHPFAYWLMGIIHWRSGYPNLAANYFEQAENAQELSLKTSAAFWAARSFMQSGQFDRVGEHLEKATESPRHFYSFLALRTLGQNLNHNWEEPTVNKEIDTEDYTSLGLERFYLLDDLNQKKWAAEELSKLYLDATEEVQPILWKIAEDKGYTETLKGFTGRLDGDQSRFPLPNWQPENDWKLDKALVYAFVRQESCFNTRAESIVGAVGLMQLMPTTAKELARSLQCVYNPKKLKNPEYNLTLGQSYLQKLLNSSQIDNNLMKLAVAYNAGPGNLSRWEKKMKFQDDPLLFLETIPSRETRSFVERILINYWIYSSLMNTPLDSLDQLVFGKWPVYQMCPV